MSTPVVVYWKRLNSINTTNTRVAVTMAVFVATTIRYLLSGIGLGHYHFDVWAPDEKWLIFIAAMSGLDLAQFTMKRKTDSDYMAAKAAAAPPPPTVNVDTANVSVPGATVNTEAKS